MQQFAVIFDMDGVIVNNGNYHKQAWEEFSKKHNISVSEEKLKDSSVIVFTFAEK